jgi:hypothetical protein
LSWRFGFPAGHLQLETIDWTAFYKPVSSGKLLIRSSTLTSETLRFCSVNHFAGEYLQVCRSLRIARTWSGSESQPKGPLSRDFTDGYKLIDVSGLKIDISNWNTATF